MILTDYYKFVHHSGTKSRFDCVVSTQSYDPFEDLKNKENKLFVYIGENTHTKAGQKGKADLAISKTKHISSIYRPDIATNLGCGDVNHTADALLFRVTDFLLYSEGFEEDATIEIFVARGCKADRQALYERFADGDLEEEIQAIIEKAQTTLY